MHHRLVAKAQWPSASGGAQVEWLLRFQCHVMVPANGQAIISKGQIYWCVLYKISMIMNNYGFLRVGGRLNTQPFPANCPIDSSLNPKPVLSPPEPFFTITAALD